MMPFHLLSRAHVGLVHLEKRLRLSWMLPSDIMKSGSRDIVCLALAHQAIVLENIPLFGLITL